RLARRDRFGAFVEIGKRFSQIPPDNKSLRTRRNPLLSAWPRVTPRNARATVLSYLSRNPRISLTFPHPFANCPRPAPPPGGAVHLAEGMGRSGRTALLI